MLFDGSFAAKKIIKLQAHKRTEASEKQNE